MSMLVKPRKIILKQPRGGALVDLARA